MPSKKSNPSRKKSTSPRKTTRKSAAKKPASRAGSMRRTARKRRGRKPKTFLGRIRWRLAGLPWPSPMQAIKVTGYTVGGLFAASVLWVFALRFVPVPGTALMLMRSVEGQTVERDWARLDQVSPDLVRAIIAAEDTKFCTHHGFDVEQIKAAIEDTRDGKRLRGASTISQQTAKNVFLWPGRGFVRKGLEAWFTLLIETFWPKQRIMEVYLNVAEWGDGYFGAEAAAQGRFGKRADALTPYEASLLASVLPNPHDWHVAPPGPYVRGRSATLRARMNVVRRDGLDACIY